MVRVNFQNGDGGGSWVGQKSGKVPLFCRNARDVYVIRPSFYGDFGGIVCCQYLGARLRGRTATQRSKKGSEKVLGRVLEKGSGEGFSEGF